jgi:4-diphosphocytidyl-2-C-methyl-D-erythritol kinase
MTMPRMTMAEPGGPDSEFAPAKVNLTLHVTGLRGDGMHLLDSVVMFADVGDRLRARRADTATLVVTGPMAAGVPTDGRNLVLAASAQMGVPAAFTLDKHLPAAAGIGGGSADAAAALRLLARLTGAPLPDRPETLGADVPVCLLSRAVRMRGVGERLDPMSLPPLPCVLVNPGVAVATGGVFAALPRKDNPAMPDRIPTLATPVETARWLSQQRNDLEAPAIGLQPVIGAVLGALTGLAGVLLARMSGSGATCFALFADDAAARKAATLLATAHPQWWIRATKLS